jgi:hypothetical protein
MLAMIIGSFFLKKEPQKIAFDSPLPAPSLSISSVSTFSNDFNLEYAAAKSFLNDNLFYPSITSFKKAEFLATSKEEKSKAIYSTIFTYFIAKKWDLLKTLYLSGCFEHLDKQAPYFQDALLIFYIAFKNENMPFVVQNFKNHLYQDHVLKAKLELFDAITQGNFTTSGFNEFYKTYKTHEKSQTLAAFLNLTLPGFGFLYLGQLQTFMTCFLTLSLLLWALQHALKTKRFAQGILIFSIFSGFYLGSIVGAKLGATTYNQTLYTAIFDPLLKDNKLYPEQNITYAP